MILEVPETGEAGEIGAQRCGARSAKRIYPGGPPRALHLVAYDATVVCTDNLAITSVLSNAWRRVQLVAAVLVHWARKSKMTSAGNQTKLLVLSQNADDDSVDCATRVAGRPCAPLTSSSFWAFAYGRVLEMLNFTTALPACR